MLCADTQPAPCPPVRLSSCLQNYIPAESLTLSCPVCRQTSILPEKGVCALQNNFFITNLMEVCCPITGFISREEGHPFYHRVRHFRAILFGPS